MSYQEVPNFTTDRYCGFERLRVDVAQTSFFEGREFRTFKELNIATGSTYVVKAVVPINIVLFGLDVNIEGGHLRLGTYVGGTEGGAYSETLPVFNANNMSSGIDRRKNYSGSVYAAQVVLTAGGTHVGGTELDVVRVLASNATAHSQSVGAAPQDERGIAAATYYFRLLNLSGTDAITGTFKARWEERPVGFFAT